jgi:exodeoxyribonuclease-1
MGFVFYDTETTGVDKVFDQILQFAAIHTDDELNGLERLDIRCRLLPHVVPSPQAMRVTGVTAAQLLDSNLPTHYTMVRAILAKFLSWSPALYIGYNSMEFDEHLLRQAFYQTLHPPYLTNTDGNCRADALRLVRTTALFAPDLLNIPTDESGKPVFKLDQLAPANGFDHSNAHDALADVEATIYLSKVVAEQAPEIWSNFVRFSQKRAVIDFAHEELIFCLTDFFYGKAHSWLVTSLGVSPSMGNELLVFDLANDPDDFRDLSDDELQSRLNVSPKVVRKLRANACPIIMSAEDAPDIVKAKQLGDTELDRRATVLQEDDALRERLVQAVEDTREEYEPWPHVEQQIHDMFISDGDKARLLQFHAAPWEGRLALLEQIQDQRLRQLGRRLIYFESPEALPPDLLAEMHVMVARRLIQGDGNRTWLCLEDAIEEIDGLLAEAEDHGFLNGHREVLVQRLTKMSEYLV